MGVSEQSTRAKIQRLGLEEVEQRKKIKKPCSTTSSSGLKLPVELPSVEEALKMLVGALSSRFLEAKR